jgi:hypothetical protein
LDNKSKDDAILRVFMKVFYEHQGFYGDIPGVAEMEKFLTNEGAYEKFKYEFKLISGEEWANRRNTFYFDKDYVIGALTKVTHMSAESARDWFDKDVNNVEISIEKFAKDVKAYIDRKGPNFHLVFLVDEIGQYIGDSRHLMLNLQTVAEDLGTYCKGKVWIIVTSQESIDSIVKVKGDDFSRIQGRFETRLSLSSISVDEVIKKRILLKKEHAADLLKLLHHEKSATLKNLISFKESTAELRGYDNDQEFVEVYPFLPYQFKLLQNVFEQVRKHGSSGKHLSEGERSMLSAFKESALQYKDAQEGLLIPFYAFYDTIMEFLNPSISRVIEGARENAILKDDVFNIDLLKVLFMIKYIKELPANLDNIASLMVTHIDEDKLALKEKIKTSLNKLVSQTLIQKNGDLYLFLTDDEQDINREIKNTRVDEEAVKKELATYIFQDLYDNPKYRYSAQYQFSFNQKMDEKNYGNQTSSIGIHILSPLSDYYDKSEQEFMLMSSGNGEMILKLGANPTYIEEMEEIIKIEDYSKKKNITQLPEGIQNILNNKKAEAKERRRRVRDLLEEAIKGGIFFINGTRMEIKGSLVKDKINEGFKSLVENVYTKLSLIKTFLETEKDLSLLLKQDAQQMTFDGSNTNLNDLAVKEVFNFISLQTDNQKQVRVKLLVDRFMDKPYGWKSLDIAGIIAELFNNQRIRVRYNAEYLEPDDLNIVNLLTKPSEMDKAIVTKRVKVDESLLKIAKNICKEVFNKTNIADDEDGLVKDIRNLIDEQIAEIRILLVRYENAKYPGKSLLDKGLEYFQGFTKSMDNLSFFMKLQELEKDLLNWEEDITDVKSFFENQKNIFDKGLQAALIYQDNKGSLSNQEAEADYNKLNEILKAVLPYKRIKEIPELVKSIHDLIRKVLDEKREKAQKQITLDFDHLSLLANQYGTSSQTKQGIQSFYENMFRSLDEYESIYKVEATHSQSSTFKEDQEQKIAEEIAEWMKRERDVKPKINDPDPVTPQKEKVKLNQLIIVKTITTEADVDKLLNTISATLKQIIKSNKQIEFIE